MEKRYRGETAIFDIDIGCQEGGRDRGDNMLSERGVSVGGATECLLDGTSPPPPASPLLRRRRFGAPSTPMLHSMSKPSLSSYPFLFLQ